MNPLLKAFVGALFLASVAARGQTNGSLACSYLLVVDTSYSMTRSAGMARQTVFDLIFDGVQGQMRPGDLFGIWTFNDQVYTNRFTPMNWDPAMNRALATGASNFLKVQPNEKKTRLDRLWAELVIRARRISPLVVILITDGNDSFIGTPFDDPLNNYYKKHFREFRRARKPLVTTFIALDGRFAGFTVNAARERIAFGELARQVAELAQAQSPKMETPPQIPAPPMSSANILPATNAPAAKVAQDIPPVPPPAAISVREPQTAPAITNAPAAVTQATPPAPVEKPAAMSAPAASAETVPPAGTEPAKVDLEVRVIPKAALASEPVTPPADEKATDAPSTAQSRVTVKPASSMEPPSNQPPAESPKNKEETQPVVPGGIKTLLPPELPAKIESTETAAPANRPVPPEPAPTRLESSVNQPSQSAPPAPAATQPKSPIAKKLLQPQTGLVAGNHPGQGRLLLFSGSALLLLAVLGLLLWRLRRHRAPLRPQSFITQSIDKEIHL